MVSHSIAAFLYQKSCYPIQSKGLFISNAGCMGRVEYSWVQNIFQQICRGTKHFPHILQGYKTHAFFIRMVNFSIEAQHSYIFSRNEPQTFLVHSQQKPLFSGVYTSKKSRDFLFQFQETDIKQIMECGFQCIYNDKERFTEQCSELF